MKYQYAFFFFLSIISNLSAWDLDQTVLINADNYPRAPATETYFPIDIGYGIYAPVRVGQTFRLKVLLPPGTTMALISAESNSWQCEPDIYDSSGKIIIPTWKRCPIMDGFDHDPGTLCPTDPTDNNPTPCGNGNKVYPQDLHLVTARLLDMLYPTEPTSPTELTQARDAYFILYQQPDAAYSFYFDSGLQISIYISNVPLYNQWVDNGRPLPVANPPIATGVTKPPIVKPPISTGGRSTDRNNNSGNRYTLSVVEKEHMAIASADHYFLCGSGWKRCTHEYEAGEKVGIYVAVTPGFYFLRWEGDCSGDGIWSHVRMDRDKKCSAIIEKQK